MHIAVVTRNMCGGGAERVIAQLLGKWSEKGIKCSLVCMHPQAAFYTFPETTQCYDVPDFSENPNIDKIKKYKHLRKLLKQIKPDVVLSMPEEIGIYAVLAMLGSGIPMVVSERNNPWVMPNKKISRIARRMAYPFAKGLIFQTQQAAAFFPKSQQRKGIVLPNPLDASRLPPVYMGERKKTVVSAGRLENQKNFFLLIEAFALFYKTHPSYKLVIYGEGILRNELEAFAKERLPENAWCMPGQVSDLPQRIAKSGIFALSSDYEGVPNVLIEAMAVGTPCVSTDCAPGGAAELIKNRQNGLLVPVKDVKALADALSDMADKPENAMQMAQKAPDIRTALDADAVADRWRAYLTQCIKEQRKKYEDCN